MVQGQLDDHTEFGDTLERQEQIRALQTELAEVKQADDEELDRLLDQNGKNYHNVAAMCIASHDIATLPCNSLLVCACQTLHCLRTISRFICNVVYKSFDVSLGEL